MQITETSADGLSRTFAIRIPAADLGQRLEQRVEEMRPQVNLKGFRKGKVPASHVKKLFGRSMMGEVIEATIQETTRQTLETNKLRLAQSPDVKLQSDIEKVVVGAEDLALELTVQVMPDFTPVEPSTLSLTRLTADVPQADVDEQVAKIAEANRAYEPKSGAAADGDALVIDFVGKIDGEVFEGGSGEGAELLLGSGRFIPGFEDQLVGAAAGQSVLVNVSFPEDYPAASLAGKAATFDVMVREVKAPAKAQVDEDFAARLGMPSLQALKDAVRSTMERELKDAARTKLKRALLDQLDEKHDFPLPPGMVEAEFAAIWKQVEADQASGQSAPEDAGKTPEELRAEYHRIAERRVRVGLVLAEIGLRHNIQVRDEEVARAVNAQARQFPGREREVVQFYQKNPQALAQVRAPLFEEKVVDFILELAKVADRSVTREDVLREDDSAPSPAQAVAQDEKPAKKPAKSAKSKSEPKQD